MILLYVSPPDPFQLLPMVDARANVTDGHERLLALPASHAARRPLISPDRKDVTSPPPSHFIQSFLFNCASFASMNARISADMSSSFSHCSLYKVTGNRPIP
jgi:hypothetical protein